jgi:hypothetical protein
VSPRERLSPLSVKHWCGISVCGSQNDPHTHNVSPKSHTMDISHWALFVFDPFVNKEFQPFTHKNTHTNQFQ